MAATASVAAAQWSSDPGANFAVADAPSDQILPKVAPTADGGAWISWFDGISGGFDVRAQRLDAGGNEVLPHGGTLVADRGFSSVQDYGLDTHVSGDALLAFRDDGGVGVQIAAARVTSAGALPWGIQPLTATTDFVAAPKIAGTSDGGAVIAWTQESSVRLMKLDATGVPVWAADVVLTPASGSYSVSDLHAHGTDVLLGFVHQTGGFGSPRHLLAQKLDGAGSLLWGAAHVPVFDGGSLQFGNFPSFEPDGAGGAVFSWYDASTTQLDCYVQRLDAAGNELFPHGGVAVSSDATRVRVSPSTSFDRASGETFVAWTEQSSNQAQSGVFAQKLDASGARQWGAEGVPLVPLSADAITLVRAFASAGGAFVFWDRASAFGQDRLFGARLDAAGAVDLATFDVSSAAAVKSRLALARSTAGFAILAWSDQRTDSGDVYAQNVNPDGSLGDSAIGTPYCFCTPAAAPCGNADSEAGCATSTGLGARALGSGSTSVAADDFVLTIDDVPPGKTGIVFMGASAVQAPFGDGLRCVGAGAAGIYRFPAQNSGAAGRYVRGPGLAAFTAARFPAAGHIDPGDTWRFQSWFRDPAGPCGFGFTTSSALAVTFTP